MHRYGETPEWEFWQDDNGYMHQKNKFTDQWFKLTDAYNARGQLTGMAWIRCKPLDVPVLVGSEASSSEDIEVGFGAAAAANGPINTENPHVIQFRDGFVKFADVLDCWVRVNDARFATRFSDSALAHRALYKLRTEAPKKQFRLVPLRL